MGEASGPAIEVRIGTTELDDALRLAERAAGLGADRIGVGTPLIYAQGMGVIAGAVARAGGAPVLANLTVHDGCFRFLAHSRRHGAAFGTVSAIHNYSGCRQGVRCRLATGIRVLADMTCMAAAELPRHARELEAIGMDGVVIALGHDPARYDLGRRESDGVAAVVAAVGIPVGCVVTSREEAHAAAAQGADWLVLDGEAFEAAQGGLAGAVAGIRSRDWPTRPRPQPAAGY